jgi:hypothetical protein
MSPQSALEEQKMFGTTTQAVREGYARRIGPSEMYVMSILSDAQEILAHGDAARARQMMNEAKLCLSDMMESKLSTSEGAARGGHTPGPWAVSVNDPTVITANGIEVATVKVRDFYAAKGEEREANARLVAASPTMRTTIDELNGAISKIVAAAAGSQLPILLTAIFDARGAALAMLDKARI